MTLPEIRTAFGAVCEYMGAILPPSQLRLSISCNTDDIDVARLFVSLLKYLPVLHESALHFGFREHGEMKKLAKDVCSSSKREMGSKPLRGSFDKLPKELRLRILFYTDLVAEYKRSREEDRISLVPGGKVYYQGHKCCTQCTDALAVCCCPHRAAAFSTQCDCFRILTGLFLVNHHLYADAQEVLFSQNRFILEADFDVPRRWLQDLPARACLCIRKLDIKFRDDEMTPLSLQGNKTSESWTALVETIRDRLAIGRLWLSIDAAEVEVDVDYAGQLEWLRRAHKGVMKPLVKHLPGLRKFHVFLSRFNEDELVHKQEMIYEQEMMGPQYDSCAEGKIPFYDRSSRHPHLRHEHVEPFPFNF